MENLEFEIDIPTDTDGYILLQCSVCGNMFKCTADDVEDDGVLHIFCPCCGLTSDNYVTDEIVDLALSMVQNAVNDILYDTFKKLEQETKDKIVSFKAGEKPKRVQENYIKTGIDELKIKYFPCCKKTSKVKPLLNMTGCYCPFCGVKYYGFEYN